MRRALVTGAAGFIGSQLCERLLAEGVEVLGIDCFSDHYPRGLKELNLRSLTGHERFELVEEDLLSCELADPIGDVDVVFHLAARPGVRDSWLSFEDYVEANILACRRLFAAAAAAGRRVVYASSSSVYGDAPRLPVVEHEARRPISPYGASKVMTEVLAGAYSTSFGLEAVGLRYFTVYGPRQRPDMGLARFIEALAEGRAIPLYGDGLQRRDMTFVGDVIDATLAAAERGLPGAVYNIASDAPRTLLEILGLLAEVMEVELELAIEPAKPGDVRDTWGDISRAAAELGYAPAVPLRSGLERQVAEASSRRAALPGVVHQPA